MTATTRAALFALGVLCAGSAAAQATGNPATGKLLFDNTPAASGIGSITMSCPACHGTVEDRRQRIAATSTLDGGAYADIDFDTAFTRFSYALDNVGQMSQFRALSTQQRRDVAAYLGDTPELTPENDTVASFTVSAVNNSSNPLTVSVKHATATTTNLQVIGVQVTGNEAGNFSVTTQCNNAVLTPGQTCGVSLTYTPRNANNSTPDLVFTLRQGASDFERVLHLDGRVAVNPPPAGNDDEGGGAFGGLALAGLAAAVGLLRRRSR
jgi:MYXO-CTERM domain-containing protein